jgi:phospholipid/cholesterol/gamma-HCH transport system ATP-binding protein
MTPVIEVAGLWTQFGDHIVHKDLNLTVMPGEVVSLVGGSGSGKTTLMRQILGLERPTRGTVKVFGIPLHGSSTQLVQKIRKRWGVLFQEGALYSALSVYDNIALPLRELRAFDEDFIHDMVMLKLDMVDIERRHAGKMPADLSGGMIKRIALARALVLEPELVFLDEPTAGLDPLMERVFRDCVVQAQQRGQAILLSSHMLSEVEHLCAKVAMIRSGRLVTIADVEELRSHVALEFEIVGTVGDLRAVSGVHNVTPTTDGVRVQITGPPGPLLAALADQHVTSLRTREASLEEIFLSYYDDAPTS